MKFKVIDVQTGGVDESKRSRRECLMIRLR